MKEAFEIFCNKTVAGSSSAELLATFCDNILKKGGSEKLSDEAIEDTLEKVHLFVKLLALFIFRLLLKLVLSFIYVVTGGQIACLYQRQGSVCRVLQVYLLT